MSDLVSRQEVIKELHDMYRHCVTLEDWHINGADAIYRIEHMPSAQPEPCEDAISRREAIKAIEAIPDGNWKSVRYSKEIRRLPSVTPNGVPDINVGKWIPHKSVFGGLGEKVYTCDKCGHNIGFHTENFCPSCGAIMNLPSADLSSYSDKLYQKAYERGKAEWQEEHKEPCWACESLENGDTLYSMSDWDGGIGFDYIRDIEYCPLCGRKL